MEPVKSTQKMFAGNSLMPPPNTSIPCSTPPITPAFASDFKDTLVKHMLIEEELQQIRDFLVKTAFDAGKIMVEANAHLLADAAYKNNSADVVTKYDKEIETMVKSRLKDAYPRFGFLGEETSGKEAILADTPTFVVDPIDGTLNFTKGVPNCAISLALTLDKRPVVGVVFNPFRGDLYTAIKNEGSFWTNTITKNTARLPLFPSKPELLNMNTCLVAVEWGNERSGPNWALRTDVHMKLLTSAEEGGAMCKSVRSNGSAALDFCYLAQGIIDIFWEGGVWVWDVAAGWLILEEAGGYVASANPGDWNPTLDGRLYLGVRHAEKPEQQHALVQRIWDIMGDRKFEWPKKK